MIIDSQGVEIKPDDIVTVEIEAKVISGEGEDVVVEPLPSGEHIFTTSEFVKKKRGESL